MEGQTKENDTPLGNQGERENAQRDKDSLKQMRTSATTIAREYICPITMELPVDPVTAEDGRVYDREAIEKCMSTQGDEFRSPITNKRMGKKLLTAFHIRNTIQHLVESAGVDSEILERWTEKRRENEMIDETKKKASEDDIKAMRLLAAWYLAGDMGFPKSYKQAFYWYNKLAIKRDVDGFLMAGFLLTKGQGTAQNNIQGASFITSAAELGSETACLHLVNCYNHGDRGFPQDRGQAHYWATKIKDTADPRSDQFRIRNVADIVVLLNN